MSCRRRLSRGGKRRRLQMQSHLQLSTTDDSAGSQHNVRQLACAERFALRTARTTLTALSFWRRAIPMDNYCPSGTQTRREQHKTYQHFPWAMVDQAAHRPGASSIENKHCQLIIIVQAVQRPGASSIKRTSMSRW